MEKLDGRRVLVVGASAGIGRGIGIGLSRQGARVAAAARRPDRLEEVLSECGEQAMSVVCDVRKPEDCRATVETVVDRFGGLDAIIYAAGTTAFVRAAEATAEDWRLTLETNLIGPALVTAAAMPALTESHGDAIYLSSNSARHYTPWLGLATYTASKRGLEALVQTLRLENPAVAFTTLVIGPTTSEFGNDGGEALAEFGADWARREQLNGNMLEPEDHARMVVEILTSESRTLVSEVVVEPR